MEEENLNSFLSTVNVNTLLRVDLPVTQEKLNSTHYSYHNYCNEYEVTHILYETYVACILYLDLSIENNLSA